ERDRKRRPTNRRDTVRVERVGIRLQDESHPGRVHTRDPREAVVSVPSALHHEVPRPTQWLSGQHAVGWRRDGVPLTREDERWHGRAGRLAEARVDDNVWPG